MGLETATYISQLVATNPLGTDPKSQGDNHLQLIKSVLQNQFTSLGAAAVTVTAAQLNDVVNKASVNANNVWTMAQDFTGATVTVALPTLASHAVSKQYADSLAFAAALPAQAGNAGKFVTTDGSTASWQALPTPTVLRSARTSNTMLVAADRSNWIDVTSGTFTQTADTAANLGNGWWAELGNSGTGVVTFGTLAIYQGQRYRLQSDGTTIRASAIADQGAIYVRDEKTSGTAAGASTSGSWSTRTLNTVVFNTISGASSSANMISLTEPGVYYYEASAPAYTSDQHQVRVFNVTGAAALNVGTSEISPTSAQSRSFVRGILSITGSTSLRVEHRVLTSRATDGLGIANNWGTNVYAEFYVKKIG